MCVFALPATKPVRRAALVASMARCREYRPCRSGLVRLAVCGPVALPRLRACRGCGYGRMTACAGTPGLPRSEQCLHVLHLLSTSDRDEDIGILALRHQISVLQRQLGATRPRFEPADRELLTTLLAPLPRESLRRHAERSAKTAHWPRNMPPDQPRRTNGTYALILSTSPAPADSGAYSNSTGSRSTPSSAVPSARTAER